MPRVLKVANDAPCFSCTILNRCECTMRFFVFFAFAVLASVHCSDDFDDLEAGENVDYQNYQDLDVSFSEKCEEHEEYSECFGDPTCQKTCENTDRWETMACARTKICIRGCVCEDGYMRDDRDVCVKETSCPRMRH